MDVLLLSSDLLATSKAQAAALRVGASLSAFASVDALLERLGAAGAALVAIDLSTAGLDIAETVRRLRSASSLPASILAFGPHVHVERLQAAEAAGCDAVLARGQFHAQLDQLLAKHAG